ncbi:hypothetical protein [Flavobacterium alkalisoli]|uniref:hypothetical protein n=1 Tax=Flavobacterium alkalisoli TaxID=2602769 RepID=UPI00143D93B1|nr:hypothetical protein [Flavobacterium alkalisoli]
MKQAKILVTVGMVTVAFAAAFIIGGIQLIAGAAICLIAGAVLSEIWKLKG